MPRYGGKSLREGMAEGALRRSEISRQGFVEPDGDRWALQQHRLPRVDVIRGNLPLELTLSERRSFLEKRHVDTRHAFLPDGVGDFLNDHLPHKGNGDAFDAVYDLFRAANLRTF